MKRTTILFCLIICFAQTSNAQDKVLFKLKPHLNKTIKYKASTSSEIEGDGKLFTIDYTFDITPKSIVDTTISLEMQFKSFKVDMEMFGLNYNSEEEQTNEDLKEMHESFKPIFDKVNSFQISNSGKVFNNLVIEDSNELTDRISFNDFLIEFPKSPIAVGEEWESEIFLKDLKRKLNVTYKYLGKDEVGYNISSDLKSTSLDSEKSLNFKGQIIVNPETNFVDEYNLTLKNEEQKFSVTTTFKSIK